MGSEVQMVNRNPHPLMYLGRDYDNEIPSIPTDKDNEETGYTSLIQYFGIKSPQCMYQWSSATPTNSAGCLIGKHVRSKRQTVDVGGPAELCLNRPAPSSWHALAGTAFQLLLYPHSCLELCFGRNHQHSPGRDAIVSCHLFVDISNPTGSSLTAFARWVPHRLQSSPVAMHLIFFSIGSSGRFAS